jgi:hypothetical protein
MANPPAKPDVSHPSGSFEVPVAADSPTSFSAQPPAPWGVAPPAPAEASAAPHPTGVRPWVVALGILSTVVITLLAISLLYYKWYKAEEYQTTIVVWAPDEWKGATVEVTGGGLPPQGLSRELTEADHLLIRFHVPPGAYTVRVLRDGQTLAQRDPTRALAPHMIWWPFRAPAAATQIGNK